MQCEVLFIILPTYQYCFYIFITASEKKKTELQSFDCFIDHLVKIRAYYVSNCTNTLNCRLLTVEIMHFKRRKTILLKQIYLTYKVYEKFTGTGM